MSTDHLLFLLASDWFVAHADALGLLPGLDQDDLEMTSVAARTPVQSLIAQDEVSFLPARVLRSAADCLARCRDHVREHERVSSLFARYAGFDADDLDRLRAFAMATRVDGNARILPHAASDRLARLDALVAAGTTDFTSWDETIDLFCVEGMGLAPDFLVNFVAAVIAPWRVLDDVAAEGGLSASAWSTLADSAIRLGVPEPIARDLERAALTFAAR